MNSLKQDVAGANFVLVSCDICIIKANLVYIDRHLLARNLNKYVALKQICLLGENNNTSAIYNNYYK